MEDKVNKIWYQMNMKEITSEEARQQVLDLFAVMQRSEQLIGFLKDYQKSCELMHVNKIDAKNFIEHWKTN
jgi:hypothetical protein